MSYQSAGVIWAYHLGTRVAGSSGLLCTWGLQFKTVASNRPCHVHNTPKLGSFHPVRSASAWIIKVTSPVPVQSLSHVQLFETPWTAARHTSLSITNSRSPPKLMSIESVMPSSHLILCHPLLLLPQIPPSIRVFSNESTLCMRWPKYWSFSFSIIPSKEIPGLVFRMDWLDLLAVQGTLKSLLQHHSSQASILQHSAFLQSNSHIHTWSQEKP